MKTKRQEVILEFIKNNVCLTQDDLQKGLKSLGFDVTQSTVSRDIKELKLVKSRDEFGNYRYTSHSSSAAQKDNNHYKELFAKSVKQIDYALNNVVIKCDVGMASSACVMVDEMFGDLMLGSLAGDDTIIIVTRTEQESKLLFDKLNKLL